MDYGSKEAKWIEMINLDDNRHIIAILCGSLNGNVLLPVQLIFTGKKCLFTKSNLSLISYTPSHWSNEEKQKNISNL